MRDVDLPKRPRSELRVALVDPDGAFRSALRSRMDGIPGLRVVGELGADEAADVLAMCRLDIVIVEASSHRLDGVALTRALRAARPELTVVATVVYPEPQYTAALRAAGARACLPKGELVSGLQSLLRCGLESDPEAPEAAPRIVPAV